VREELSGTGIIAIIPAPRPSSSLLYKIIAIKEAVSNPKNQF
jgi:hypothetical protein